MNTRTLLIALGIVWAGALAGLIWMMTLAMMSPHHALLSFIIMGPALKICVALSVASAAFGMLSGLAGLRVRARLGVGGALGWGVVGALLGAAGARNMLINMNPPIPFSVYAPNYVEALLVLLVGLTGAILGLAAGYRTPRISDSIGTT